jgi:primary-amine oxidase
MGHARGNGGTIVTHSPAHPLDPLTAAEIRQAAAIVRRDRGVGAGWRFASIDLREPAKGALETARREATVVCWDRADGQARRAVVSLADDTVSSWEDLPGQQPNMTVDEWHECDEMLRAHPELVQALARRGITDLSLVLTDMWAYGAALVPERYRGLRIGWSDVWYRDSPDGNPYAHHVTGLHPVVDLNRMQLLEIEDDFSGGEQPSVRGEYAPGLLGRPLREVAPLEVSQPAGVGFTLEGRLLSWQNWQLRLGFNYREGLVLHQVGFSDGGRLRPVAYRMSFAEMFVPYRDASLDHYRRTAFDIGEWGLGFMTTSLELGCDCLGEIRYLDAVVHDSHGEPREIPHAICIHEEDSGVLWKHVDERTGAQVRRQRRLVVSFHVTVANYEYLVYWRFYQDGAIECEVRATGIVVTSHAPGSVANGTIVDQGTYAPFHQHFIVARLDLDVDGPSNTVHAVSSRATGASADDPYGLGLEVVSTPLRTEAEGKQDYDWASQRAWKVVNPGAANGLGSPVGYKLVPSGAFPALLSPSSPAFQRAEVIGHTLWVTPYHPDERWPCGDFPNLSMHDAGLPAWTSADRSIENTDVVLWYVFGIHHITRPEDWPVMPTDAVSFWLKPFGFFDRNPALDVPPAPHCAS